MSDDTMPVVNIGVSGEDFNQMAHDGLQLYQRLLSESRAQLAERDTKLKAIRAVVHRWVDSEQGSNLDNGGGMLEILEILTGKEG